MQDFTRQQTYIAAHIGNDGFVEHEAHDYERLQIEPLHPIYGQTELPFSEAMYKYPSIPLFVGKFEISTDELAALELNVLNLMIRENSRTAPIHLPKAAESIAPLILQNINYHRQFFEANADAYVYLTVRVCDYETMYYRNSATWHVDGYQGARAVRQRVEQNMLWSNVNPTQFSIQPYFCEGINPRMHDINEFFERKTSEASAISAVRNGIYFVNPYHVHRVCPERFDGKRVFVRVNFSPVLIEDPRSTENPRLPQYRFAKRVDVRNFLHAYEVDEAASSGFMTE
ncbi:hypothetical protein G6L37_05600 [Agrobacterium rubi]|nr:hypothetical protein [Agrobacterium rubi]NTF24833.1 hypothetical protein [Agrobacterium rubi]